MAIGPDTQTRFPVTDTTGLDTTAGNRTFTHTPIGTPRGVVVVIGCTGTTSPVTGVLYGGVAMTFVQSAVDTSEAGSIWIYFLGSGLPTGAQTVTLQGCTTASKFCTCSTVTAASGMDTKVYGSVGQDTLTSADPNAILLNNRSRNSLIYGGVHGGAAAPTSYAVGSGYTLQHSADYGQLSARTSRLTTAAAFASRTYNWTAISDDWCVAAIAIGEHDGILEQTSYRWRNDDGSESAATWRQAVNTPDTITLDTPIRLRVAWQQTYSGADPPSQKWLLQYRRDPGTGFQPWTDVDWNFDTTEVIDSASANITSGQTTTRQIWASATGFIQGSIMDTETELTTDQNGATTASFTTEWEFSLVVPAANGAVVGDVLEFRMVFNPTGASSRIQYDSYVQTPSITIAAAGAAAKAFPPVRKDRQALLQM